MVDVMQTAIASGARSVGTPFYLFELWRVREAYQRMLMAWTRLFPHVTIAYSYKTNPLRGITTTLSAMGAGAEVVSGTELQWALADGFPGERIFFNGPIKHRHEVEFALDHDVSIHVDSLDELDMTLDVARSRARAPRIALRVAAVGPEGRMSRFGLQVDECRQAMALMTRQGGTPVGLHFHVGSNLNAAAPYTAAIDCCADVLRDIMCRTAHPIRLDIGGGFSAQSAQTDAPILSDAMFAAEIAASLRRHDIAGERISLVIEPGRRLVEDFGYLVAAVLVKKQRGTRRIIVLDTGLNHVRSMQVWKHPVGFVSPTYGGEQTYDIYGCGCFESDLMAQNVCGPRALQVGDLVVIGEVGGYDMATAVEWTRTLPPVLGVAPNGAVFPLRHAATVEALRHAHVTVPEEMR